MAGEEGSRDTLSEGKARHQTVLESSRNSEQKDLKEKGRQGDSIRNFRP